MSTPLATADRALYAERCRVVDLEAKLAASEARVRALEEALTTIRLMCADGYYGPYAFTYAMEAKRIAALALAPPLEAEKRGGNDGR